MMLHVRHAVRLLVILFVLAHPSTPASSTTQHPDQEARPETVGQLESSKDPKNLFSPRMEYDEWTPLGRGDPLKNDPTYDYVPPVLERVHYWIEPSSRTPDPPVPTHPSKETQASKVKPSPDDNHRNSDSSSADSRRDIYDPYFLKFVDGPKFTSTQHRNYHHIYHHHYYRRPPTLSHQSNSPPNQRLHHYMPPYHSSYQHKNQQKQRPYESQILSERNHQKENHKMEVDTSNSSRADHEEKHQSRPTFESPIFETDLNNGHNGDDQPPRAPYTILVPPPLQIPSSFTSMSNLDKPAPISEANKVSLLPSSVLNTVTVQQSNLVYHSSTSSTPIWEEGKTQLATTAAPSSGVTWKSPAPTKVGFNTHATSINKYSSKQPYIAPMSVTTMHNMLYNPSLIHSPNVEIIPSTELHFNDSNNINFPEDTKASKYPHQQPQQQWSTNMIVTTVPPTTITMTTSSSLTTDPLFSHYKQPVEPLRGPMYLIIQGHSKVKTYGANKNQNTYHGIPLQENNHISNHALSENKNDRIGKKVKDFGLNDYKKIVVDLPEMEDSLQLSKNEGGLSFVENEIPSGSDITTSIPTTMDKVENSFG